MVKILLPHNAGGVGGLTAGDKQRGNGQVSYGQMLSRFLVFRFENTLDKYYYCVHTVERIGKLFGLQFSAR